MNGEILNFYYEKILGGDNHVSFKLPIYKVKFSEYESLIEAINEKLPALRKQLEKNNDATDGGVQNTNVFTGNFQRYNVGYFDESEIFLKFREFIKKHTVKYYRILYNKNPDSKISYACWLNELNQFERIGWHKHQEFYGQEGRQVHISANMSLCIPSEKPTYTIYYSPLHCAWWQKTQSMQPKELDRILYETHFDDRIDYNTPALCIQNVPGLFTFFPSFLGHETTQVMLNETRVSLGLDFFLEPQDREDISSLFPL